MMLRVSAEVVNPESGTHDLTNVFHFTLKADKPVPEVIPRSYQGNPVPSTVFHSIAIMANVNDV